MNKFYLPVFILSLTLIACPSSELSSTSTLGGGDMFDDLRVIGDAQVDLVSEPDSPAIDMGGEDVHESETGVADQGSTDLGEPGDATEEPIPPVARTADFVQAIVGDVVNFDGSDSSDEDGEIVRYSWDFGDSESDEGSSVEHIYTVDGLYSASLTVEDDDGLTHTAAVEVQIDLPGNEVPIALIEVTDEMIIMGQEVQFDGGGSYDPDGTLSAYHWTFESLETGEVVTNSGVLVIQRFDFWGEVDARLEVTDDSGARAVDVENLVVHAPPEAVIEPLSGGFEVGDLLTFNGGLSSDLDGLVVDYQWDFGDGSTSFGMVVSHDFDVVGNHNVTLTVFDDDGLSGSASLIVGVDAANQPPVARAGDDQVVLPGETVTFDGSASYDPDGDPLYFQWDFGDGGGEISEVATHAYDVSGDYTVSLTVQDEEGLEDVDSLDVRVNASPVALIAYDPVEIEAGTTISFNGSGSYDPDGDGIVIWNWSFGDGGGASSIATTHAYSAAGIYNVSLTVIDAAGASGTVEITLEVTESPLDVDGAWRLLPFGSTELVDRPCNTMYYITLMPQSCTHTLTGTSLEFDCGGMLYTGELTGSDFTVEMSGFVIDLPPAICGDATVSETITGTFIDDSNWEGMGIDQTYVFDLDTPQCRECVMEPYPIIADKTGG